MDMSEEHSVLYNDSKVCDFIDESYFLFDEIEDFQRSFTEWYYLAEYCFDVFPLNGDEPDEAMKKYISECYEKYEHWPPLVKNEEKMFYQNEFFGQKRNEKSLEEFLTNFFNVKSDISFLEYLNKDKILEKNFYEKINTLSIELKKRFGASKIEFFDFPKSCKGFYNDVLNKVYFIILSASYIVFKDYVVLLMHGTSE